MAKKSVSKKPAAKKAAPKKVAKPAKKAAKKIVQAKKPAAKKAAVKKVASTKKVITQGKEISVKELPQREVIINKEKVIVPPFIAINLEANANN